MLSTLFTPLEALQISKEKLPFNRRRLTRETRFQRDETFFVFKLSTYQINPEQFYPLLAISRPALEFPFEVQAATRVETYSNKIPLTR